MSKRICPDCGREYTDESIVCDICNQKLIDVSQGFEEAKACIPNPVLLANDKDVWMDYLCRVLGERHIPYFTEEMQTATIRRTLKGRPNTVFVPVDHCYVDENDLYEAKLALDQAIAEMKEDENAPVEFVEVPKEYEGMLGEDSEPIKQEETKVQKIMKWLLEPMDK